MKREKEPFTNKWCFPGGSIEQGEDYLQATKREVKEETGLDIIIPEFHLLKIAYINHFIIISSISEYNSEDEFNPKIFQYENFNLKWFKYEETLQLDDSLYVKGIKELIPKAFKLLNFNKI